MPQSVLRIHEHLAGPAHRCHEPALPQRAWEQLLRHLEHWRHANRQAWQSAARSIAVDLQYSSRQLRRELETLENRFHQAASEFTITPAGEIASDLIALETEFEEIGLDLADHSIEVVTLPIRLEDIYWALSHNA